MEQTERGVEVTYMFWKAFKPKDGKLSNPQLSPMPLKNHLKQLKRKLMVNHLPKHLTCFLHTMNNMPSNYRWFRPISISLLYKVRSPIPWVYGGFYTVYYKDVGEFQILYSQDICW
jgi:hypothetical protein